jgi:NADH-quinone oxidoreductase subunit A
VLDDYFRQYALLLILLVVATAIPVGMMAASRAAQTMRLRPSRPSGVKLETYECGVETVGGKWRHFDFRYYRFALLFLVFDVLTVFVYPWAVHFKKLGFFALVQMLVFLALLGLSWAYAWRKRALEWG